MSDTIQEYLLITLGILFTLIPIIREIKAEKKPLKKRPRVLYYICFLFAISLSIFFLGIKKVNRDKQDSIKLKRELILIRNSSLIEKRNFKQFEKRLNEEFHIQRDLITNMPKPAKSYDVKIQKAETVNIGND